MFLQISLETKQTQKTAPSTSKNMINQPWNFKEISWIYLLIPKSSPFSDTVCEEEVQEVVSFYDLNRIKI